MAPVGRIMCAGLGPGDPDLISVRSDRIIRAAHHIAYFRKAGRQGQARRIVDGMLAPGVIEHAMEYPVTTEIPFDCPEYNALLAAFYDEWTARFQALTAAGEDSLCKALRRISRTTPEDDRNACALYSEWPIR